MRQMQSFVIFFNFVWLSVAFFSFLLFSFKSSFTVFSCYCVIAVYSRTSCSVLKLPKIVHMRYISALPDHAGSNIGHSFHSEWSDVFCEQHACHQRSPQHYILCFWNCNSLAVYVWSQVDILYENSIII